MVLTDLVFVGRLGPSSLAVIALANIIFNMMFYCLCGVSSAFDTLGAQAHGAGNPSAVRAWAALAAVVNTALCVPMAVVLCWASGPLSAWALGTDVETSRAVGAFCAGLVPGLLPAALTLVLQKYLTVRGATTAVGACAVLALLLNAILNQVLIHGWPAVADDTSSTSTAQTSWFSLGFGSSGSSSGGFIGYGIAGSPMATSGARVVQLLLLLAYCWVAPSAAHGCDVALRERGAWADAWQGLGRALLASKREDNNSGSSKSGKSNGDKDGQSSLTAAQPIETYEIIEAQSPPSRINTAKEDEVKHALVSASYGTLEQEDAVALARSPLELYLKLGFEGACMFVSEVKRKALKAHLLLSFTRIMITQFSFYSTFNSLLLLFVNSIFACTLNAGHQLPRPCSST